MGKSSEFEHLMEQVAAGSEDAIWKLVDEYTPYIIRSVRLTLSPKLRPKVDSQDIAQSLWASLLLGDRELSGLKSPGALIAFLAKAARNKVTSQQRHHHALKRDISREVSAAQHESIRTDGRAPASFYARDPTPSKIVAVREKWDQLVAQASERDRHILRMRVQQRNFGEISAEVQVSEMTARRAIERLVDQLCE
jgi:RNA polymerase sigma factor (sigma-70 family)